MFASTVEPWLAEADLASGRLRCPGCQGALSPWGFARERTVRTREGGRRLRPRRVRCGGCQATHVIVPAWSVPRRRDSAEVIGEALLAKAQGEGYRRIAARLARPPETVRGWLRSFARRAQVVRRSALRFAGELDLASAQGAPAGSSLVEAVEALGVAARACRLHLRTRAGPWELAVVLSSGLLHGAS